MTELQVIDWISKMAKNVAKERKLTPAQKTIFDSRLKTMAEIKAKIKRIDYFGGVETLIAKASLVTQKESLFPVSELENTNS